MSGVIRPDQWRLWSPRRGQWGALVMCLGRRPHPQGMGVNSDKSSGHNIECDGRRTNDQVRCDQTQSVEVVES